MSVTKTPIGDELGIEIRGLHGHDLVDPTIANDCLADLPRYGVVLFREAFIRDDDLVAFTRLLGEAVVQPTGEHEHPEIQTITSDETKTDPRMVRLRRGNDLWHIDGTHDEFPQKGTLLSAIDVAGDGGDTEFANLTAAFEALPEEEKAEIGDLRVIHSFATAQKRANPDASEEEIAAWERLPARTHPLVWNHADGRRSLVIGATAREIEGWPLEKGQALLDRLLDWCTRPSFVLRHAWRKGDLVVFDNTGLVHRALPFEDSSLRLLHRTTLVGEEAVA
jgi:alpha-ketoglutarate-dependent taurine dioxygenase